MASKNLLQNKSMRLFERINDYDQDFFSFPLAYKINTGTSFMSIYILCLPIG